MMLVCGFRQCCLLFNRMISPDSSPLLPTAVVVDSCLTICSLPFLFFEMLPNIIA